MLQQMSVRIIVGFGCEYALDVTISCIYCNSATREAFSYLFEALFALIEKAAGRKVRFKVFDRTAGNLLAVILDMEAAQVQGLGDAVL
jgi:hypothetical protein